MAVINRLMLSALLATLASCGSAFKQTPTE